MDLIVKGNLRVDGTSTAAGPVFQEETLFVESFARIGSLACQGNFVAAQTANFNSALNVSGTSTFAGDIVVPSAIQSPAIWNSEGKLKSGAVGILTTTSAINFPSPLQAVNGFTSVLLNNCSQSGTSSSFRVVNGGVYCVQVTFVAQTYTSTTFMSAGVTVGPSSTTQDNSFVIGWGGDTLNVSGGLASAALCGCVSANANDYISVIFNTNTAGAQIAVPATFTIHQIA